MAKKATDTAAAAAPAAAPAKETVVKITQNGMTRPKDDSKTGRVWAIADEISAKTGKPAERKAVVDQVHAEGINTSTGATQYGKWRKFHGLVGEASPGKAPKPAKAPAAPAAPAVEETGA